MSTRLPVPGQDDGTWGSILNDFLSQSLAANGSIKPAAIANKAPLNSPTFTGTVTVPAPSNATDAATKTYVDSVAASGGPDATTSTKGNVRLAGDLAGTASMPTVARINGILLPSSPPSGSGQVLTSSSTTETSWATPAAAGQQPVSPLNALYAYGAYESSSIAASSDVNFPLNQYVIQSSDPSKLEVANGAITLKAAGIYMAHAFFTLTGGTAGQQLDAVLYYDESTPDADTEFSFAQRDRQNKLIYTQTFLIAVGLFGESATKTLRLKAYTPSGSYSYIYADLRVSLVVEQGLPLGRAESSILPAVNYSINHVLNVTDLGYVVEIDATSDLNVVLPNDGSIPIGAVFEVMRRGTGAVSLTADSGVTILTPAGGLKIAVRYASATIRKSGTTTYIVDGDLIA